MVSWGTWLTLNHLRSRAPIQKPQPVSILKPLKGVDFELEENIESFFRLTYPKFELLFSVASETDEAFAIVSRLSTKYPRVRARVFVGDVKLGQNPKVNNLIKSYQAAHHDWILVSDSNIRVSPTYLESLTSQFDDSTGIVTAVVSGRYRGRGFGAPLEATYLNTFYARWMLIASWFGAPVVIGKTMLFRKSEANRFGGVEVLSRYLAEDYMAGYAMKLLGKSVKIMSEPTVQMIGSYCLKEFWLRHVRWGRIRKSQSPLTFPLEPLLSFWVSLGLGIFSATYLHLTSALTIVEIHFGVWLLADVFQMWRFGESPKPYNLLAWLARETLFLPLWMHIACGNTVTWRGTQLRIQRGGLLECPDFPQIA